MRELYAQTDNFYQASLCFADDMILFSKSITEVDTKLEELREVGKRIGLRMSQKKTQSMKNASSEGVGM